MMESPRSKLKVYSIQVSNISCINCANTIKSALSQKLQDPFAKVAVNIMSQKITLTVSKDQTVDKAIEILKTTKFLPLGSAVLLSGNVGNQRSISFLVHKDSETQNVQTLSKGIVGVVRQSVVQYEQYYLINFTYNCEIVKGRDIADIIEKIDSKYEVKNGRVESLVSKKKQVVEETSLKKTVVLVFYFLFINMIIPALPIFSEIYKSCVTFPSQLGVYSFSVIFNIFLTGYVMKYYAKGFILRAYDNYSKYKTTNMQTLIALGSLSACCLFLFFMVRYSIENYNSKLHRIHMAIMDINDALTSASIIVLVVTIGKNIEKRVKVKIEKITDQIFPESVLFQNMNVHYVQMRNRQLKVLNQKVYNVSLIEKNDLIKVQSGRLLLDVCIISGSVKATQSARTGSQQILTLSKGDRIESGSIIHDANDCFAVVQKTIENSLLIEIATHIKFSQNQEESQASGIQTLCNRITSVFVKGVIILSFTTMLVWIFILYFEITQVPICNACWVIQRGIGVLVASCPCALGLAVPSVIAIILKLATKSGILIKKTKVFEKIKTAKIVAFDKTGTLFTKINQIESYLAINKEMSEERLWQILALLQRDFRHPLAEIIYKEAVNRSKMNGANFSFILLEKTFIASQGMIATILDKQQKEELKIVIGNKRLLRDQSIAQQQILQSKPQSCTQIYLSINGKISMIIYINTHSNLRPQTLEVIHKLEEQKLEVHILSGDSKKSVEKLGQNLKISSASLHAQYNAMDKLQWVKNEQNKQKNNVIMVGDGLNDIPCLQEAGIGISINAKSELNINAADVVILSENIYKILALIRFLRRGNLFIKINLFWAFAYNIVIMPIVAGVFYKYDIFVSPVGSCIAMSLSSLLVVGFSHLLSLFKYDESVVAKSIPKASVQILDSNASTREVLNFNEALS